MKILIKSLIRKIIGCLNNLHWEKQYKSLVSSPRKSNFEIKKDWYKGLRILLMVPHADDELISSYSVLCNADDLTIYYCGFTGSNKNEDNRVNRRNELLKLCSELEIKVVEGDEECKNLVNIIDHGEYDTILLPSIVDWHDEHRRISYMIKGVCASLGVKPAIYSYSVTVPNESQQRVLCTPLSAEQLREKYDIFRRIYLSQKVMPLARLTRNEMINGYHAGCFAAETFSKYDYESWIDMVSRVELLEGREELKVHALANELYNNLNNLILVRKASREFYSWLESEG